MPTRRTVLEQVSAIAVSAAVSKLFLAATKAEAQTGHRTDEMTVTSAPQPQQEYYPPPDFGPLPTRLPPETEALRGSNSLNAHAARSGLIAGAAVVVDALRH